MPNSYITALSAIFAATVMAAPIVGGQERRLDTPDPRYGMTETADGYLRLDRETGEVSHCRRIATTWSCTVTPDERRAMEEELAALRTERQALRIENERLRAFLRDLALRADRAATAAAPDAAGDGREGDASAAAPPDGQPDAARGTRDRDGDGNFTDEAKRDIDRALDVTAYAVKRLFDTFRDLEDELSTR